MIRFLFILGMITSTQSFAYPTVLCSPQAGSIAKDTLSLQFSAKEIITSKKNSPSITRTWTLEDPGIFTYYAANKEDVRQGFKIIHFLTLDIYSGRKIPEIEAQSIFKMRIIEHWWNYVDDESGPVSEDLYNCLKLY